MTKLKELEKRLKNEPDNLGLQVLVAGALHEAGRRDDSIDLYRSVAMAYRDQGRSQQAITACHSALAIAPDDVRCLRLLSALLAGTLPPREAAPRADRPTPPPLPSPPRAGRETGGDPDDAGELERQLSADVTPLPAPLPYHIADPTSSMPVVTPAELPLSLQDELARYPQIAGIANAARQISASLIAASAQTMASEDDVSGELQTRRLSRISAADLQKISGPPPVLIGELGAPRAASDLDDDEPTLLPSSDPILVGGGGVDDELTEPRELPLRTRQRPPSIAPSTTATGPLTGAFFVPVPPRNRAAVLQRFRRRMTAHGATVIRRGETGHGLIIVVAGLLELHAERADGQRIVIGAIAPGEYIGEASLLARAPAAVDVIAAVNSELMVLGEYDFHEVTSAFPALRSELKHVAERRSREYDQRLIG
jgi:hypothetical protein